MNICLVISGLRAGGAERVMAAMANHWAGQGQRVTLITFEQPGARPYYALDPAIALCPLGVPSEQASLPIAAWRSARRLVALRRAIQKCAPDVVISFLTKINVLTLLATRGMRVPVIASERNNPRVQTFRPTWTRLRDALYRRAFSVVCLTADALACFPEPLRRRGRVIPVQVAPPAVPPRGSGRVVMAVGRLVEQKGFDLLLEAFATIALRHPEWSLVIYGEGAHRARLERLRDELGLAVRVRMPGLTERPSAWIADADLFVLSSRFEGFCNALAEALAAGLPVASFDCPWGPGELIRSGENGLLVPVGDVAALGEAISTLIADAPLRARLGEAARRSMQRYAPERVMAEWEAVVADALRARAAACPSRREGESRDRGRQGNDQRTTGP
ncbi:MAG: glycosyltransferase family 4 protein [Geminicoccaceae bacterium]